MFLCILLIAALLGIMWAMMGTGFMIFATIIVGTMVIAACVHREKKFENVYRAEIVGSEPIYTTGYEESGYSFSSRGNVNVHYRKRTRHTGDMITFRVYYSDPRPPAEVSVRMDSSKYKRLLNCGTQQPKVISKPKPLAEKPIGWSVYPYESDLPPLRFDYDEGIAHGDVEVACPAQKRAEIEEKPEPKSAVAGSTQPVAAPIDVRRFPHPVGSYIGVETDILPNEYDLSISGLSLRRAEHSEKICLRLQFEARFNGQQKGVRNREIVCALVNGDGCIIDTRTARNSMDASGAQLVDIDMYCGVSDEVKVVKVWIKRCY